MSDRFAKVLLFGSLQENQSREGYIISYKKGYIFSKIVKKLQSICYFFFTFVKFFLICMIS